MGYTTSSYQGAIFKSLFDELSDIISLHVVEVYGYPQANGFKSSISYGPSERGFKDYYDIVLEGPSKNKIFTITPPYSVADLNVIDEGSYDLGDKIREGIAKFWQFGEIFNSVSEEVKQLSFIREIHLKSAYISFKRKESSEKGITEEIVDVDKQYYNDLETALREIIKETREEFLRSMN